MVCPGRYVFPLCTHGQLVSLMQPPFPSDSRPSGHMQPDTQFSLTCNGFNGRYYSRCGLDLMRSSLSVFISCLHRTCYKWYSCSDTRCQLSQVKLLNSPGSTWEDCTLVRLCLGKTRVRRDDLQKNLIILIMSLNDQEIAFCDI